MIKYEYTNHNSLSSRLCDIHLVSGSVALGCLLAYLFFSLWIYFNFCFRSLFFCFFISLREVVLDSGLALLMLFAIFYFTYCFLLKKFTLNTPNKDSMNCMPLPSFVLALNLNDSYLPFYLYLAKRGYSLSYSLLFYPMSLCLISCLAFLLWALAN